MKELNLLTSTSSQTTVYGMDVLPASFVEKPTGVEGYCRSLVNAMKRHPLVENEQVVLYSLNVLKEPLKTLPQGWTSQVLNWSIGRGWMPIRMSWEMWRRPPTVLFVPGQALPLLCPRNTVTTVHDVAFARYPDLYQPAVRKRLHKVTKRAIKKATQIIVPSQTTKNDLIELYHAPSDRIQVTPLAVDTMLFRSYTPEESYPVLQKHRLGAHVFLCVGRLEKKKNIATLIRAFEVFKQRRGVGDPFELVLIGEPGFGYEEIKVYVERSAYKQQIRLLGYVPDEEVAVLMSQATAYVFPSWYEGFGIPNLEVMASGTPLMTSDIPVHREVVGSAGLLVEPGNADAWAKAMERVVENPALREELVEKGKERVAQFSWDATARKTWEVLRSLV